MGHEYVTRCVRCSQPFHSSSRPPYSGRCGHSQCRDCADSCVTCPVRACLVLGAFRDPKKNILATEYLDLIDKEEENIIAIIKGIDEVAEKLPTAPVLPKLPVIAPKVTKLPVAVLKPAAPIQPQIPGTPIPKPRTNLKKMVSEPLALNKPAPPPSPSPSLHNNFEKYGIIVTNLPPISEEMLKARFGTRKVIKCKVMTDFDDQPTGEAYLWYAKREDAEKVVNKVYIGNLPHNIEKNKLEDLFSLCGPILNSEVIKYDDHTFGERAYGFIEFEDYEGARRAFFFNKKAYEGLILSVSHANRVKYGTFLGGIPYRVPKEDILSSLEQMFGDKFYDVHYERKGYCIVNFKDDETRHEYINTTRPLFSSSARPQIKEYKREDAQNKSDEFVEVAILKIPGGTTEQEVEKKFQLCGPTSVILPGTDNYYVLAYIRMTRSGYETAKKFDGKEINWDTKLTYSVPIQVLLKNEYDSKLEWTEYGHTLILKNYDPTWQLKEIEEKFFKTFGADSVRVLRGKNKKTFLYVNIKEKSAMDKILAKSGEISFGGAEPATFEPQFKEQSGKLRGMKSTLSVGSLDAPRKVSSNSSTDSRPKSPAVRYGAGSTRSPWEIVAKNVDVGMDRVKALFEQIGKVESLSYMASDDSHHIKFTPKF